MALRRGKSDVRQRPPRDVFELSARMAGVQADRTAGGRSSPYRTMDEVINAPDGSARRGLVPRKSHFTHTYPWTCPDCDLSLAAHWSRCPDCGHPRARIKETAA